MPDLEVHVANVAYPHPGHEAFLMALIHIGASTALRGPQLKLWKG